MHELSSNITSDTDTDELAVLRVLVAKENIDCSPEPKSILNHFTTCSDRPGCTAHVSSSAYSIIAS